MRATLTQVGVFGWLRTAVPMWRLTLLVLAVNVGGMLLLQPFVRAATSGNGVVALSFWITALASPITAFARALLLAVIAWAVATLARSELDAWRATVVFLAGEVVRSASVLLTGGVLAARGLDSVRNPADLHVPQGLDFVLSLPPDGMIVLNQHFGIFQLCWLVLVAMGLRRVAGARPAIATAIAICCWLFDLGLTLVRMAASR